MKSRNISFLVPSQVNLLPNFRWTSRSLCNLSGYLSRLSFKMVDRRTVASDRIPSPSDPGVGGEWGFCEFRKKGLIILSRRSLYSIKYVTPRLIRYSCLLGDSSHLPGIVSMNIISYSASGCALKEILRHASGHGDDLPAIKPMLCALLTAKI